MPSCNLAETVHNKWLQQSRNRGNDLYVATVDDLVRAFMQMVRYYQFLKGEHAGSGPGKEELLKVAQRCAHRTGNPKVVADAISNIQVVQNFVTREPHLEGKCLDLRNGRRTCLWAANRTPIDLTKSISLVHVSVQDLQWQVQVLQPQRPQTRTFHSIRTWMSWRQCHQENIWNVPRTVIPCT